MNLTAEEVDRAYDLIDEMYGYASNCEMTSKNIIGWESRVREWKRGIERRDRIEKFQAATNDLNPVAAIQQFLEQEGFFA